MFGCFDYAEAFIFSKNLKFIGVRLLFLNKTHTFERPAWASQDSMSKQNDNENPPKQKQQQNPTNNEKTQTDQAI